MASRKWLVVLVLVLVVAAGAFWLLRSRNASANISEKDLITVQRVDFPLLVEATGSLEALRSVDVGAPQVRRERRFKLMRIVEEGTHEELLKRGGLYASLWSIQSRDLARLDAIPGAAAS